MFWKVVTHDSFWESLERFSGWKYQIKDFFYKIKCYFIRYTTIKPRYLDHTWRDKDTILAHFMFEILSKFIEDECSPGHVEWYGEYPHTILVDGIEKNVRDEMQDLYNWWHNEYIPYINYEDEWNKEHEKKMERCEENNGLDKFFQSLNTPKEERTESQKELMTLLEEANKKEDEIEEELKHNMHRLVNIYRYMWT